VSNSGDSDRTVGLWNGLGIAAVILALTFMATEIGRCAREDAIQQANAEARKEAGK